MLRAAVLGEPGGGTTTFLGLLYAAQLRAGTERGDRFRFFSPPECLAYLTGVYERMMGGEFPGPSTDDEVARVRIELAYRRSPGILDRIRRTPEFDTAGRVEMVMGRSTFATLAAALESKTQTVPLASGVVQCTVPILIVPAVPQPDDGRPEASPMPSKDAAIVRILGSLRRPAFPENRSAAHRIHPVLIFSKLDLLLPTALRNFGLTRPLTEEIVDPDRSRLGESLTKALLPKTWALTRSAPDAIGPPAVFFSFVGNAPSSSGGPGRIRLRTTPDHLQEPEYPATEYRALLERLGALADQTD
ncbi:MAG: hypothetical protein L3K08_06655 [Thermoplasmata archaeon]|nr:hypothetical protein [Thermoplasmata archaeon]